ncbi:MAG: tetratricopeptide repeat protein, partial [Myxococcota bacterium]
MGPAPSGRLVERRCLRNTITVMVVLLLSACWSAQPEAEPTRKVVQDSNVTHRTLDRSPVDRVTIDATLFQPFFLSSSAPDDLRAAYNAFQLNKTHEARLALQTFRAEHPKHALTPRATFMLAYIEDAASREAVAAELYEEAAAHYPELAEYARYYGARAAYKAKDYTRAARLCRGISMGSRFGSRAKHLRGESLLAEGSVDEAIKVLEEVWRDHRRASWSTEVRLDLARAYEQAKRDEEAAQIYQKLRMRYPGGSVEERAEEGIRRLRARLPKARVEALLEPTPRDRVLRARALYDKHRSKAVVEEMTQLRSTAASKEGSAIWCDATWLIARANGKLRDHGEAAAHYLQFIERCGRDKRVIKALYAGGRSLWNIDEDVRALELFQTIWRDYPNHSYADDAVLYAARIHHSNGQSKEYRRLLNYQIETFPRGDMLADAHWHNFSSFYRAGNYAEAVAYATKVGKNTGESDLYTRGRMAYFKARSLEQLGRRSDAVEGFVRVSRRVPMSYYALLALNRLKALDQERFTTEMSMLARDDGARARWTLDPPQLAEDSGFKRGVELLRLGLFDEARQEFNAL